MRDVTSNVKTAFTAMNACTDQVRVI